MRLRPLALLVLLAACSDPASTTKANDPSTPDTPDATVDGAPDADADATVEDAAPPTDSSPDSFVDADANANLDAGADADANLDASADADAPPFDPTAILGTLTGACPLLSAELQSTQPSIHENAVTFVPGETYARDQLSSGGQRLFDTPNAGGSSAESEVMSYEVLHFCEGATLLKTETEIGYDQTSDAGNSITDILLEFHGLKIGVSVTRAYKPAPLVMGDPEVKSLLEKKLHGINVSSRRVLPQDAWVKQILHVFVANEAMAASVKRVLPTIDAATRADTIVVLTRTQGGGFVYCKPLPALGSECPPLP
jgi:hypothetical protein